MKKVTLSYLIKSRTANSIVYIEFVPSNAMFFGVTL